MVFVKHHANIETPIPSAAWASLGERQRVDQIISKLEAGPERFLFQIQVITAKADGQVIVRLKNPLPVDRRGPFLLDLEEYLKAHIDDAIAIWLEPLGDRNSLRNLRGIEVKVS
jgi:hypothetical protein